MDNLIITLSILSVFALPSPVLAGVNTATIEKLENSLYGFTYSGESENSRLDRIENSVYGTVSTKSANERVARLKKDMATDLIGQEIEPVEDTFADPEDSYVEREPVAASNVNYPAVDELEEMVFNKNFHGEDIKKRLSKLEMQTFGKEYNDDLSTRTDRLKAELKPQSLMDNEIAQSSNDFYDDYVPPLGADYHLNKYQQTDMFDYDRFNARQQAMADAYEGSSYQAPVPKQYNLTTVEKGVLRQTFKNDTTENRLSRLENTMFGTNFSNDDNETRINRISSAYKASKSASKYDSNRFSQNMTTAMQIGTLLLMVLACIL